MEFYDPKEFKCIIIDEAHHAAAKSYTRVIDHFKINDPDNHILLCKFTVLKVIGGCSATLRRHDGISLGNVFDKVVFYKHIGELITDKFLSDIIIEKVYTNIRLHNLKMVKGDYSEQALSSVINVMARNRCIVEIYKQQSGILLLDL